MRIARDEVEAGQRELPGRAGRSKASSIRMSRRQEQGEAAVGRLQDTSRQGDDAVDQLAEAEVGEVGVWQQHPALPPVEEVGGEGSVEQERFKAGEGARPQPFE